MTCKHCHREIKYKKGVWYEVLGKEYKAKMQSWSASLEYNTFNSICVRGENGSVVFGNHEPTKEDKVKRILDQHGT